MTAPERIVEVLNKEGFNLEQLSALYQGNHRLFDGYAIGGNAQEMANVRECLHALLDCMLDSTAIIFMMRRKLGELQ